MPTGALRVTLLVRPFTPGDTMNLSSFKYAATTPKHMNAAIRAFCNQLSAEEPVFLDVQPSMTARAGMCYANATQLAERLGGRIVFGWLVWELDGIYVTAEHHSVVEADGQLIDVTPQIAGERSVLFVPDHETEFHPPRPANKYAALVEDSLIEHYVEIAQRNSNLELEGKAFGYEHANNDRQNDTVARSLSITNKEQRRA
jgi:hypothetical protein